MKNIRFLAVALAAIFIVGPASAQNAGTVTSHAFAVGKGPGTQGFTSLLCASAQLAVGQSAADPLCRTLSGDVTLTAAGVTAIGASKVTNAQHATMAANTTKCNATAGTANPTDCTATTMKTNLGLVIGTNVEAWDADLDCLSALATTGVVHRTGSGTCSAAAVSLTDLAVGTQDTVIGYFGATTGAAVAINNCTNALTYSTSTHTFGCNSTAGTGTVVTSGSPAANQVAIFSGATTVTGVTNGVAGQSLHANTGAAPTFQSGGWVLLNTLTASSSATLTDTTSLTATYSEYEIVVENMLCATASQSLFLQVRSGGTFQTSSYTSQVILGTGTGVSAQSLTAGIPVMNTASCPTTGAGVASKLYFSNPSAAGVTIMHGTFAQNSGIGGMISGSYPNAGVVDQVRLEASSGNLTSGVMKIYGRL